jgi:TonB-linked SusC/RagA family outer membrane protein
MKKNLLYFLWVLCLVMIQNKASAQERVVSGKVTSSEDGSPIPGVNVILSGTTTGTITDAEGTYRMSVPQEGGTIIFSFVGMKSIEVAMGSQSVIDVQMESDFQELGEVVVTALGSERNASSIVYANQTVKGEDLLSTPNKNALEALRGKAAGVRLSTGSGSVGASTRIVLRGEGSLTGNNNALIIVDGIAIDNTSTSGGAGTSTDGYADHGNRFNDINPDDIESVTILKGPSATSLYGSRGASGVVLITTKKGKKGDVQVRLNSSYSQEKAYILMQRQDRFGQGYDNAHFDSGENWSWGPEFDGVVRPWTSPIDADGDGSLESLIRPYSAVPDQIQEFFNTGNTLSNSISFSGANEGFTYYASFSNVGQSGILDNTKYKRNTVNFNATAKLSEKLSSDFKISYASINQNTAQEGSRAFEGNNAYAMVLQSPVNIPFGELRDYNSPFHGIDGYWGSYSSVNPYFILNEFGNEGKINNVLGNASLSYNIIEGLDFTTRFGSNVVSTSVETWTPKFTPSTQLIWGDDLELATRNSKHASPGDYTYFHGLTINRDVTATLNYMKNLTDDISMDISAGYNFFQRERKNSTGTTNGGLLAEGIYNLGNSVGNPIASLERRKYRIYGVLANARFGFRDALFLEYSVRNDWSSTLPENSNSFLYQSVGTSVVLNDLIGMDDNILNFAKIRGSIGTSGKDAGLYLLNSSFTSNPEVFSGDNPVRFPINQQPGSTVGNLIGSPNLKPELTLTYEFGSDLGFFGERIEISYTYYKSEHRDQIVEVSLPRSSGFTTTASNIGLMTNKGHELTLSVKPIYGVVDGLDVELFGSWAKNVNEVVKVADDISELSFGTYTPGVTVVAKEGEPFGTYKSLAPLTNQDGQVIVDPNTGYPLYTEQEVYLGSYQPDFIASFGMSAKFKGIGFNILFDMKQGGNFGSQTKFFTEFNGTSEHTAIYNRESFIYPNSVIENDDGTYSENTIEITEQDLFTNYDPAASTYIIDASFLKLREIGLSYDLPRNLMGKIPFSSARISLFAKNLKFWLPGENTFADPEVNGPALTGNAQGIETSQTPTSKSFGVNLQLTF